ncbi:MAG: hypothetical protein E3J37_09660 [Anaerolineales bacterium]|nr:MAG: hypothetical protein E3J37_09660 [Anaerolineales bacterium]
MNKTEHLHIRASREDKDKLATIAKRLGLNMSRALIVAIEFASESPEFPEFMRMLEENDKELRLRALKLKSQGYTYQELADSMNKSTGYINYLIGPDKYTRKEILNQRNNQCYFCGLNHKSLHLHHIDYSLKPLLIPLCPSCHRKLEWVLKWSTQERKR